MMLRRWSSLVLLVVSLAVSGCSSLSGVREAPFDEGGWTSHEASFESAVTSIRYHLQESITPNTRAFRVSIVGEDAPAPGLWRIYGNRVETDSPLLPDHEVAYVRVMVRKDDDTHVSVALLYKDKKALQLHVFDDPDKAFAAEIAMAISSRRSPQFNSGSGR